MFRKNKELLVRKYIKELDPLEVFSLIEPYVHEWSVGSCCEFLGKLVNEMGCLEDNTSLSEILYKYPGKDATFDMHSHLCRVFKLCLTRVYTDDRWLGGNYYKGYEYIEEDLIGSMLIFRKKFYDVVKRRELNNNSDEKVKEEKFEKKCQNIARDFMNKIRNSSDVDIGKNE